MTSTAPLQLHSFPLTHDFYGFLCTPLGEGSSGHSLLLRLEGLKAGRVVFVTYHVFFILITLSLYIFVHLLHKESYGR